MKEKYYCLLDTLFWEDRKHWGITHISTSKRIIPSLTFKLKEFELLY